MTIINHFKVSVKTSWIKMLFSIIAAIVVGSIVKRYCGSFMIRLLWFSFKGKSTQIPETNMFWFFFKKKVKCGCKFNKIPPNIQINYSIIGCHPNLLVPEEPCKCQHPVVMERPVRALDPDPCARWQLWLRIITCVWACTCHPSVCNVINHTPLCRPRLSQQCSDL